MAAIIVPASIEQKKDFKDIIYGGKTPKQLFIKKLTLKQQEYTKESKPFCYICAKQDWEDQARMKQLEFMRYGQHDGETKLQIDIGDLDNYGIPENFELLDDPKPKDETVIINGTKVPQRAYMRYEYRCIKRRHGMTVDMPWYLYQEKQKAIESKTPVKDAKNAKL